MNNNKQQYIYQSLLEEKTAKRKKLAVLIDPDKLQKKQIIHIVENAIAAQTDYFFIGGSLLMNNKIDDFILHIKTLCEIPVILFPGSIFQISEKADALLFLSLISGRNADLLIGQQVVAAPILHQSSLEILSTGYMLIDGGRPTTASYISNSTPIPADKPQIAVCTALAGQMLGLKLIYLDCGSGAKMPVSSDMIRQVRQYIDVPLIVGGGIRTAKQAVESCRSGADIIVVGNAIEHQPELVFEMAQAIHALNE
ncbi:MAG: geranylgeranylglyceryl/heptaprenylglyceryl phosphate synthase [Chitinophagales bacterium]